MVTARCHFSAHYLRRGSRDTSFGVIAKSYRGVVATVGKHRYPFPMETSSPLVIAVIEQAGVPALRIAFTLAVIVFLFGGITIFRRRHQFFDRDPNVENDVP